MSPIAFSEHCTLFDNRTLLCSLTSGIPSNVNMTCWIKWSATFTPDQDGEWDFGLVLAGQGQLLLDGKVMVDNSVNQKVGELFFGLGSIEEVHLFPIVSLLT